MLRTRSVHLLTNTICRVIFSTVELLITGLDLSGSVARERTICGSLLVVKVLGLVFLNALVTV